MDGSNCGISLLLHIATGSHESSRKITIAVTHGECSFCRSIQTVCRISIHTTIGSYCEILQISSVQLRTEIEILCRFSVLHIEDERNPLTVYRNLFCHRRHGDGHQQECK